MIQASQVPNPPPQVPPLNMDALIPKGPQNKPRVTANLSQEPPLQKPKNRGSTGSEEPPNTATATSMTLGASSDVSEDSLNQTPPSQIGTAPHFKINEEGEPAAKWNEQSFAGLNQIHETLVHDENHTDDSQLPPEEFVQVNLNQEPLAPDPAAKQGATVSSESWEQKNLEDFKLDVPTHAVQKHSENPGEEFEFATPSTSTDKSLVINEEGVSDQDLETALMDEEVTIDQPITPIEPPPNMAKHSSEKPSEPVLSLSKEQIEKIVKDQSQELIRKAIQQLVPEIATNIIREEIERLTKDKED